MATKIYGLKMIEKISELFVFSFILIHVLLNHSLIDYVTVRAAFYKRTYDKAINIFSLMELYITNKT